ncbi:homocysteine-responsive endoplasmic reticulum-resident ubiquitin-like domain member 2 protein [Pelobates fuscus]|uniref:homocysteine-responsive endoplasmic reticulum-resident ubiquitin-like domain member 2 protein n=1 Tax=Pelobates fuscus TaxID=191477 RepID=UPI002FE46E85
MDHTMMDSPVTLVIKAPNQKYDDQTINCFLDWTVEKLKSHLSKVYPSKPMTKDQRLVYSGKLLLDHLRLKDVLRKQDEYHMVHLVCASRTPPNSPKICSSRDNGATSTHRRTESERFSRSEQSGPASTVSPAQDMPSTSSISRPEENLRNRHASQMYTNPIHNQPFSYFRQHPVGNPVPGQGGPAVFPVFSAISPLQVMWWQQMYARQYYMQYQAAASHQTTQETQSERPASPPAINSERPPPNPPRAVPNVAPEVNPNVQMNAQGGPVMNEEDINRDWLDWLYTVSRAAILLSIVYFYSSFSRFVMVMGAMILVYMHQAGWFPFRQEGQQPARVNVVDVDRERADNDFQDMERRMDEGLVDEGRDDTGDDAAAVPHPGLVASAWSFITTFFTSLIPEGPP